MEIPWWSHFFFICNFIQDTAVYPSQQYYDYSSTTAIPYEWNHYNNPDGISQFSKIPHGSLLENSATSLPNSSVEYMNYTYAPSPYSLDTGKALTCNLKHRLIVVIISKMTRLIIK